MLFRSSDGSFASAIASAASDLGVTVAFTALGVTVAYTVTPTTSWYECEGCPLLSTRFASYRGAVDRQVATLAVEDADSGVCDTYRGKTDANVFSADSTGYATDGSQVCGSYGLSYDGAASAADQFPVVNSTGFEALSAAEFDRLFEAAFFGGDDVVDVTRSSGTSRAMGYSYTVVYRHEDVGADQPLLGTDATNLDGTGAQVDVVEVEPGTQIYGSFQLRFGGETTGPLDYDASADDVKHALDALISIAPSQVAVTRDGPMTTGPANGKAGTSTQVGGYVWSITFASNGEIGRAHV